MSTETWDHSDYARPTLTTETPHGVFRAVVALDEYPEAPDYDQMVPVWGYEFRGYGVTLEDAPRTGSESDRASGVDFRAAVAHFYDRTDSFSTALEHTDRWLRIFHGGSVIEMQSRTWQGDPYFLAYDTRAMRESWGQTGELLETTDPTNPEWQAFLDGDVWIVTIERAVSFEADGEPVVWETAEGPVGGFYGEEWAKEEAAEMLSTEVAYVASQMLPLEVSA